MQCHLYEFVLSLLPLFLTVKFVHAYDTPQFPVTTGLSQNDPASYYLVDLDEDWNSNS